MHEPESILENEMHKILSDFDIQTDHRIPVRSLNLELINKRKKELVIEWILLFQRRMKMKESKKINKYLDIARELKKLWLIKVSVIPIIVYALEAVCKGLKKKRINWKSKIKSGLWDRLRSARILRRILEICCYSDSSERVPVKIGVKKLAKS